MTVSISRCCANHAESRALLVAVALSLLLSLFMAPARADEGRISSVEIVPGDGGYVMNADIDLELSSRLAEAVVRGVSLYFVAELRIERPRWYWFNDVVIERTIDYRLSYAAIPRNYRLSVGNFHQSFDNLEAAVRTMLRIRNWQVAGFDELKAGVSHDAGLRFRLDTSQLPKPFQVNALGNRDWNLGTDWLHWTFLPGVQGAR